MGEIMTLLAVPTDLQKARYLGPKVSEDDCTDLVQAMSEYFESMTNRHFIQADYSETLKGSGSSKMLLSQYPINEVTSITVDDEELDGEDYTINKYFGIIELNTDIFERDSVVEIEWNAGYADPNAEVPEGEDATPAADAMPADLQSAILELCVCKARETPNLGIQNESVNGQSASFAPLASGTPWVLRIIDRYTKVA